MKVVLVHPYISVRELDIYLSEPLGLICLSSYLKAVFKEEIDISILDLYALGAKTTRRRKDFYVLGIDNEEYIQAAIKKLSPDIVGITCNFTAYSVDSLEVAAIIKRCLPNVPIMMGGAHATIEATAILESNECIDYVVRGEGEVTTEQLLRALQGQCELESVEGLTFRKPDKTIHSNEERKLIKDLDILPIPDRSLLDVESYKYFNKKCVWYARQSPVATIMTSRGCPYNCIFCSTKVVWKRTWRPRSLHLVFQEIEQLVSNYGIKEIIINDDQFFTKKARVDEFCDYFIERKLGLSFAVDAGVSVWLIDEETLWKMRKAGFYSLRFPIESGNENTIKFIKKPVDLKKTQTLIETANTIGFWVSANLIIGFPYETRAEIEETIRYAYTSKLDFVSFLIAKPNAGSELYEIFKREGLLEKTVVRASHFYRSDYDTTTMTAVELNDILARAAGGWFMHKVRFFANPANLWKYFLPKFRSVGDVAYFFKVLIALFSTKIKPLMTKG